MKILLDEQINSSFIFEYIDSFYFLFKVFLIILLILSIISLIYITGKKASEQQKWLQLTLLFFFLTLISYYGEVTSKNIDTMFFAIKMGHISKALSTLFFLKYTSNYCRVNISEKWMRAYYCYITWISICIIYSDRGTYFYRSYQMKQIGPFPYFVSEHSVVFYIYSYGLCAAIFIVFFMIIKRMVKVNEQERKRLRFLFSTGLIPVLGYVVGACSPHVIIDFVPITFGISAFLLFVASKQHGLLDVVLSAKESIIENTKEGVIVVDNEYNVLYANSTVTELMENIWDLKIGEEMEQFKKLFQNDKTVLELKDKMYEISASYIYENTKVRGKMAWLFDVTESQNYTKEILRLKDEAEKANQAKTAFLANMSHEIRTPMNAILGFSELVIQQEKQEKIRDYMYDIKNSAKNLLHIINQILDISKIESGKTEIVEEEYYMQALLEDVMAIITNQAQQKGLVCKTSLGHDIPAKLYGAVVQIREILINILNNAVKYTQEGFVTLRVKCENRNEEIADFYFEVQDTGVGMKQEDVDRIYDRFRKFDSMNNQGIEGSGLGMYIVKSLVTSLNGTINISSIYGKGTTIQIMIPQKIVDHTPIEKLEVNFREEQEHKKNFIADAKILVVDDNEVNLKLITSLLLKYKLHPDMAIDGENAIEKVRKKTYDLIYMDHMMPGMDGVETMLQIRKMENEKYKDIPIIILTANAIAGVKEEMIAKGFQDYISKPIDVNELEKSLLNYLPQEAITYLEEESTSLEEKMLQIESNGQYIDEVGEVLKHFKVEEGIKNCGGSFSDYKDILKIVHNHGKERVEELRQLYENKDYKKYTINVHSLKSTAYNIGAMELGDEAKAQEMAGKHDNFEFIEKNFELFLDEYQIVLLEIKKWLMFEDNTEMQEKGEAIYQNRQIESDQEDMEIISDEDRESILVNVGKLLDDFELDKAQEILRELLSLLTETKDKETVQNILHALEQFDVEKAKALLTDNI